MFYLFPFFSLSLNNGISIILFVNKQQNNNIDLYLLYIYSYLKKSKSNNIGLFF